MIRKRKKSVYRIDLNQDLDLGTVDLKEIFREFPTESNMTSEQMDLSKSLSSVRGVVTVGSGVAAGALIIARNSEIGLSREVGLILRESSSENLSNGTWHFHAQSPTAENNLLYADSEVEEIILTEAVIWKLISNPRSECHW